MKRVFLLQKEVSNNFFLTVKKHEIKLIHILQNDRINVMVHQMITPSEKEYVIIQPDYNCNFILQPDDTSNSIPSRS
jgi:hypothetical protein